jgi:hypothetical protein
MQTVQSEGGFFRLPKYAGYALPVFRIINNPLNYKKLWQKKQVM